MNKKIRNLLILSGVLVLCCVGTFALSRYHVYKEKIENTDETILEINPEEVTTLSWNYTDDDGKEVSLAFHTDDSGSWVYDDDEAFPVDPDKVTDLLELFENFGASFVISDVEDYGQYGLDDPTCVISFTAGDTDYTVDLGSFSTMDQERYVSLGNDGKAYLVSSDPLDTFGIELKDMILDDDVPDMSEASEITFSGTADYTAAYTEDNADKSCDSGDKWFAGDQPLDTDKVSDYLTYLSYPDQSQYVTYNASDDDLASYGLDDPRQTVTVRYTDEDETEGSFVLHLSREPGASDDEETDEDDTEEIYGYMQVGDSKIIYGLSEYEYKELTECSYNDLRHDDILTASFDDVTSVDFVLDDVTYTMTASGEDDEKTWSYDGQEDIDFTDIQGAVDALSVQETSDFTDETPEDKTEISLTVHLDNEAFPEVKIDLCRYDGSYCLAVVDGETIGKIPRSQVVDLIEAVNAIVLN